MGILGALESVLRVSWLSWGRLGAVLGLFGGRLGDVLGRLWGFFGRPGASRRLYGTSGARFSHQNEALHLGYHFVFDFYTILHGFVNISNTRKRISGIAKILVFSLPAISPHNCSRSPFYT